MICFYHDKVVLQQSFYKKKHQLVKQRQRRWEDWSSMIYNERTLTLIRQRHQLNTSKKVSYWGKQVGLYRFSRKSLWKSNRMDTNLIREINSDRINFLYCQDATTHRMRWLEILSGLQWVLQWPQNHCTLKSCCRLWSNLLSFCLCRSRPSLCFQYDQYFFKTDLN